jgi:hypothetical protein
MESVAAVSRRKGGYAEIEKGKERKDVWSKERTEEKEERKSKGIKKRNRRGRRTLRI